jgi:hypothetical protein
VFAFVLLLVGLIWYPIRQLWAALREDKNKQSPKQDDAA